MCMEVWKKIRCSFHLAEMYIWQIKAIMKQRIIKEKYKLSIFYSREQ